MKLERQQSQQNRSKQLLKKVLFLLVVLGGAVFTACEGPQGVQGPQGAPGTSVEAEVFELRN